MLMRVPNDMSLFLWLGVAIKRVCWNVEYFGCYVTLDWWEDIYDEKGLVELGVA